MTENPRVAEEVFSQFGVEPQGKGKIAGLILQAAKYSTSAGVVVCRMSSEVNIENNISWFESSLDIEQQDQLFRLLQTWVPELALNE